MLVGGSVDMNTNTFLLALERNFYVKTSDSGSCSWSAVPLVWGHLLLPWLFHWRLGNAFGSSSCFCLVVSLSSKNLVTGCRGSIGVLLLLLCCLPFLWPFLCCIMLNVYEVALCCIGYSWSLIFLSLFLLLFHAAEEFHDIFSITDMVWGLFCTLFHLLL